MPNTVSGTTMLPSLEKMRVSREFSPAVKVTRSSGSAPRLNRSRASSHCTGSVAVTAGNLSPQTRRCHPSYHVTKPAERALVKGAQRRPGLQSTSSLAVFRRRDKREPEMGNSDETEESKSGSSDGDSSPSKKTGRSLNLPAVLLLPFPLDHPSAFALPY